MKSENCGKTGVTVAFSFAIQLNRSTLLSAIVGVVKKRRMMNNVRLIAMVRTQ